MVSFRVRAFVERSERVMRDFIARLPKAEIHVHLEGCFELSDVERLAREAGERLPRPVDSLYDLTELSLSAFLQVLDWTCGLVRTREQLARAAYAFAEREARAGVRYADLIVNPTHWSPWRGRLGEFVDALDGGFHDAEVDGLPPVGLCISLLRQQTASEALELVDWIQEQSHPRIVALSIDGNEAAAERTGPRFADAFRKAAEAGIHRTVHAGESSGPEGVWDALEFLRAERIDHGVRAIEDPALVSELASRQVTLNVCPGSNVRLGLFADLASHPLDVLRRAGVPVSINTDDPALMGTDLIGEYVVAAEAYGWDRVVVADIARAAVDASFCEPELKKQLRLALDSAV